MTKYTYINLFYSIFGKGDFVNPFASSLALIVLVSSAASLSVAGDLALDSRVLEVTSTSNNRDVFQVKLDGGRGPCANEYVTFHSAKSQSEASYNQAFSIALAALMSGNRVRVHNYEDNECSGANFISIYSD